MIRIVKIQIVIRENEGNINTMKPLGIHGYCLGELYQTKYIK